MQNDSLSSMDEEFSKLYERNIERVYRICILFLKNRADAEDAAQSVFLKYLKASKSFNEPEHEKAWFITTSKNACKDILKSFWRSHKVDIESISAIPYSEDRQENALLEKLLSLPYKYKEVMYLYYYENYSVKEMASLLKRNQSTIRTQLSKGRALLKVSIGGFYE